MLTQMFSVRYGVPVDEVTTQEYALQRLTFPQTEFVVEEEPQVLEVSISYPESHMKGRPAGGRPIGKRQLLQPHHPNLS